MTRRDRPGTPTLLVLVCAWASLAQAADGGDAGFGTAPSTAVSAPRIDEAAVGERPAWRRELRPSPERISRPRGRDAASTFAVQTTDCDDHWDCGSAAACDPFTECSVDLYACVVNQKTGRGQCVHRGQCDACQPFPGSER